MHFLSAQLADQPLEASHPFSRTPTKLRGRVVGAALLCFVVDPVHACVYFLLGKERHNVRWPTGSNRWSDFGGRTHRAADFEGRGTERPEETAAREFYEETLAVVRYFATDTLPRPGWQDIAASLQNEQYMLRLNLGNHDRQFVLFVKQIPWDPDVVVRFAQYRAALTCPRAMMSSTTQQLVEDHPARRTTGFVPREFLEKKTLGLWSVPQLRRAVQSKGVMNQRNGYAEHCRPTFVQRLELVLEEMTFYAPHIMNE